MEEEKTITIKATETEFENLFGAVRLGIWLEDWCTRLQCVPLNDGDTTSSKWMMRALYIVNQMKKETGITKEWKNFGEEDDFIELLDDYVCEKCNEWKEEAKREGWI